MKWNNLPTPCYVVDKEKLVRNLQILKNVEEEAGCKILLAQKCFSMYALYPLIGEYISGATASGLFEARLGFEEMKKENHVFAPAYKAEEFDEITRICDHIIFNSVNQLKKYEDKCSGVSIGLRINPEFSTNLEHAIYDPCAPGSRLGTTYDMLVRECGGEDFSEIFDRLDGLHFHTLCEQDSLDLVKTFEAFEKRFGKYLYKMKWLNMGGGHHITRENYHLKELIDLIKYVREKYDIEVYLEPGEAVALNAGYLVTTVEDIVHNDIDTLILDASAACHMPDVLEMPYRPPLMNSGEADEKQYTYRLSSMTCLAGDIIGDYSFDDEVKIGDRLVFEDMAIYSMVKNNTFNGMCLPSIAVADRFEGECELVKQFGYEDFKERLS